MPAGDGLVAPPASGPAQGESEPGAADQPGDHLPGQPGQPGGLGDRRPDRADAGRARLTAVAGYRCVAESDQQVSVIDVIVFAAIIAAAAVAGRWGDTAGQGGADGGGADLGQSGQGPAPADAVEAADLALVRPHHLFPR